MNTIIIFVMFACKSGYTRFLCFPMRPTLRRASLQRMRVIFCCKSLIYNPKIIRRIQSLSLFLASLKKKLRVLVLSLPPPPHPARKGYTRTHGPCVFPYGPPYDGQFTEEASYFLWQNKKGVEQTTIKQIRKPVRDFLLYSKQKKQTTRSNPILYGIEHTLLCKL